MKHFSYSHLVSLCFLLIHPIKQRFSVQQNCTLFPDLNEQELKTKTLYILTYGIFIYALFLPIEYIIIRLVSNRIERKGINRFRAVYFCTYVSCRLSSVFDAVQWAWKCAGL